MSVNRSTKSVTVSSLTKKNTDKVIPEGKNKRNSFTHVKTILDQEKNQTEGLKPG